jgi:hypothetical protein
MPTAPGFFLGSEVFFDFVFSSGGAISYVQFTTADAALDFSMSQLRMLLSEAGEHAKELIPHFDPIKEDGR